MDQQTTPQDEGEYRRRIASLELGCEEIITQLYDPHRRRAMPAAEYTTWAERARHALQVKRRAIAALRAAWAARMAQETPEAMHLLCEAARVLTRLYGQLNAQERHLYDRIKDATEGFR